MQSAGGGVPRMGGMGMGMGMTSDKELSDLLDFSAVSTKYHLLLHICQDKVKVHT